MKAALLVLLLGCSGAGQSAGCRQWLTCWRVLPAEQRGTQDEVVYGPDGECWKSTPDVAKQCDAACKNAYVAQSAMAGAPAECR